MRLKLFNIRERVRYEMILFIIIFYIRRVDWLKYINHLLAPHIEVDIDEVVIVNVPSYITNLEVLLYIQVKVTLQSRLLLILHI